MNSTFTFVGHSLDTESGTAIFSYQLHYPDHNVAFLETLHFPTEKINKNKLKSPLIKNILDQLLLIIGISYWKSTCATTIETPTISLTQEQAHFWNTVYTKGLGEFFYKNNIDYRNLVQFPFINEKISPPQTCLPADREGAGGGLEDLSLLFFGGGKDSLVSAELLKTNQKPFTLFTIGNSTIQEHTANKVPADQLIFERKIDPKLFIYNKEPHVYNGHVPVTAIWSFIGLFAAALYDYKYLIGSNEHSANYGNVQYLGQEINHQWSKSVEFETLFQNYVHDFITPSITYFSLLRPLHEMKIAQIFSQYTQYFPYFSSCNRNFKIQDPLSGKNWCGECPKCVFVFLILAAFLPKNEVVSIFEKNILDDVSLLPLIKELLGKDAFKPFECVGTPEETQLALSYIHKKAEYQESPTMQFFEKEILPTLDIPALEKEIFSLHTKEHMPETFQKIMEKI